MKKLNGILQGIDISSTIGNEEVKINSICYDSRKSEKGSLFVALRGSMSDGHDFIKAALFRGSAAVICEELPECAAEYPDRTFIITKNSRAVLAKVSHAFFDNPSAKLKVIGITGTNGKTTNTFLIRSILEEAGYKTGVIGTTGVFYGDVAAEIPNTTPESLDLAIIFDDMLNNGITHAVMEVSSHALCTNRVDGITFAAALFTNLTHDHLDYHKTIESYAAAKKMLFQRLNQTAIAAVNSDDHYAGFMLNGIPARNKIKIGRNWNSDYKIKNETLLTDSTEFTLKYGIELINIKTRLVGKFNVENAAICAAVCHALRIGSDTIVKGLANTTGAPGRMQRVAMKNGAAGIVDYAHTPDALEKALLAGREILESENKSGRLICVFGCGGDRDTTKRPEMGRIASSIADFTFITSDNPRTEDADKIITQIYNGVPRGDKAKVSFISNRAEAIRSAVEFSKKGDIILVAGKGHEKYQIIGKTRQHFDDVEELTKY